MDILNSAAVTPLFAAFLILGLGILIGFSLAWYIAVGPKPAPVTTAYDDVGNEVIVIHEGAGKQNYEVHYRIVGAIKTNQWAEVPIKHPIPIEAKHDYEAECYILDSLAATQDKAYIIRKCDARVVTW